MKIDDIFETVVDGKDKFKQKRSDDFSKKIQSIANDIPNVFRHQAELEKHVADEIEKARAKMNKTLKPFRLKLANIMKEYQPQVTVAEIIYYHDEPHDEHYEEIKAFVDEHGEKVLEACEEYLKDLEDLVKWSKQQKWPAGENSLMRYTRFGYAIGEVKNSIIPSIKKLMKK